MKRILLNLVACIIAVAILAYAGDYLALRIRAAANWNAFGKVSVRSYYAVGEKNGRTEYIFKDVEDQTCVRSLFAHLGCEPCWYLNRHPENQIKI